MQLVPQNLQNGHFSGCSENNSMKASPTDISRLPGNHIKNSRFFLQIIQKWSSCLARCRGRQTCSRTLAFPIPRAHVAHENTHEERMHGRTDARKNACTNAKTLIGYSRDSWRMRRCTQEVKWICAGRILKCRHAGRPLEAQKVAVSIS